jgi:DNA-damage-inducible protein J
MASRTQMIHARIDPRLKKSAEAVFSKIGLSTAEAIRLFLTQVEIYHGLPFPVVEPNAETIAAMRQANAGRGLKRYGSFKKLRESL